MDLLSEWSIKIAEVSVPEEVDLAPFFTEAFIEGGEEREQLFQQNQSNTEGAAGLVEGFAIFPWILRGITAGAQLLFQVLSSENVSRFITAINDSLEIKEKLTPKQNPRELPGNPSLRQNLQVLPDDPYKPLKQVMDIMSFELQESGLSVDEADLVTFRVVRALLEEPSSASLFIKKTLIV
ncbi:hypothetical protein [Nostoc sp.]|uniref:hypothetical protein n=1 Tax=Nostoc sp. TaxID=1180 RepID=UPI002FF44A9F